jgi:hypothetical protein
VTSSSAVRRSAQLSAYGPEEKEYQVRPSWLTATRPGSRGGAGEDEFSGSHWSNPAFTDELIRVAVDDEIDAVRVILIIRHRMVELTVR